MSPLIQTQWGIAGLLQPLVALPLVSFGTDLFSCMHYSAHSNLTPGQTCTHRCSQLQHVCVSSTGVQSQEELLLAVRHRVRPAEQPHPPAEEDMAGHWQVCGSVAVDWKGEALWFISSVAGERTSSFTRGNCSNWYGSDNVMERNSRSKRL